MKFKNSLDDQVLEPEIFHLNPKKSNTERFKKLIRLDDGNLTIFLQSTLQFIVFYQLFLQRYVPSSLSWYGAYLVKAFPLDMSQYDRLLASTRIPLLTKDKLVTYEDSRHILVLHKGNYYTLDVISETGE